MLTFLAAVIGAVPMVADTIPIARVPRSAPPIEISINNDGNFAPGGLVNVRVQTQDDGYLMVFRVDGDGRIRVIFPLDPDADAFVRGGKEYELRGRADRSTFIADDRGGSGMIYAAIAHQSYNVRDFSANGHWDYDALRLRDTTGDAENELTSIVGRMTNRARFDYDAVGYRVQDIASVAAQPEYGGGGYYPGLYDPYYNPRWRCMSCGWGYPGTEINVGFGYSPFWDPWLYSPWGYNYGYGFGYGFTGNNWWYGGYPYYPVGVSPRQPLPGSRSRPRPGVDPRGSNVGAPSNEPARNRGSEPSRNRPAPPPPPPTTRSTPPPAANPGTRSRPRPNDIAISTTPSVPRYPSPSVHPVFRQPQTEMVTAPRQERPQSRPVYREPPQVYRAPPPPQQSAAPRSAPTQSAPAARQAPPSSGGSSGGSSRSRGGH